MSKISMQEYADRQVKPEYRQPLMTIQDAVAKIGWAFEDRPECCGKPVKIFSFIGPYHAVCETCGKFVADITGPSFAPAGNCVWITDSEKVDFDGADGRVWISGIEVKP